MISSIRLRRKHVASVYSISSFEEDDEEDDEDEMLVALALRASSIPYSRYVELYEKAREADRGSEQARQPVQTPLSPRNVLRPGRDPPGELVARSGINAELPAPIADSQPAVPLQPAFTQT